MNVIVVGAGLFGSLLGQALENKGHDVTYIDSNENRAGSKPAACLMKPGWFQKIDEKPVLKYLEKTYENYQILKFRAGKPGLISVPVDVYWVPPKDIMHGGRNIVNEKVIEIKDGVVVTEEKTYKGLVIVAAGVWTRDLLPKMPEIRGLVGSCVVSNTFKVKTNIINTFAPYKQLVSFMRAPAEAWAGDGTSIIEKNFNQEHKDRTRQRVKDMAGFEGKLITGTRPYVKGDNLGLFAKLGDKLFVSTGGAKNGTILGADHALKLLKALS